MGQRAGWRRVENWSERGKWKKTSTLHHLYLSASILLHLGGNCIPSTGNEKLPITTLEDDRDSVILSPKTRNSYPQGCFWWESRESLEMSKQCKIFAEGPTPATGREAEDNTHRCIHSVCSTFSHFCQCLSWTGFLTWWHSPAFIPVRSEPLVVLSLLHCCRFLLNKSVGQESTKDVPAYPVVFKKSSSSLHWVAAT